ncbi:unnamed protein product [Camellia sinensis]
MHSPDEAEAVKPLKRSFEIMNSKQSDPMEMDIAPPPSTTTSTSLTPHNFRPRGYQLKVFEVAMRRNTIAVLETGAGKTMIAVMIINDMAPSLNLVPPHKNIIVFLAPTVHLVHQQFEVMKVHTNLRVEEYYGAKGVDEWNAKSWEKEINDHDVLVLTPQILLDALRKAFVSFEMVCLMIIDECHRATASPVIRKGVSSLTDCEEQISELEGILDSQIYTVEDRTELEEIIPSAEEICRFYDPAVSLNMDLKAKLESSWKKFDALLLELQGSISSQYRDTEDKYTALRKRLSNDNAKILYCLDDLGLLCAYEACNKNLLGIGSDCSKTLTVLICGSREARQVLCLIFVERIITAKVIERVMKRTDYLSHLTVSYLTGSNSSVDALAPKVQKETLESFRSGKVNLLFATDVVEEGIHVPNCSSVIRFDLPKTVRSYVQSRGRARQNDSHFVMMLERGNIKQRDHIFDIIRSEYSMTDTAINRDPDASVLKACTIKEIDAYYVDATGASVTVDSSVNLIHRYCEKLPRDEYFTPKPIFQFILSGESYQCNLTLPPNAAFQTLVGPPSRNSHLSKQLVCFDACKKLHQMGALNDHLLPFNEEPSVNDSTLKSKGSTSSAGTTKRKELHGTTCVHALSGTWGLKPDGTVFQAYRIHFTCNIPGVHYSSFVLLIDSKLDDDVGNVVRAMCFQEFFFNGIFGKLFVRLKSSRGGRKFLLQGESLWEPSNMYLLLPLESSNVSSDEPWRINWMGINSCVSVVEFLKENAWLSAEQSSGDRGNSSVHGTNSIESECKATNVIHLANKSIGTKNLREMVVLAIHTGRIYSVLRAVDNTSAESPFDGNSDAIPSSYSSFAEYFSKKYGITLMHPGQPLLLLKQSHNAHNLLVDFRNEGASFGKNLEAVNKMAVEKPRNHVHMPPELLVSIDVPINVLKSFYLLPSLMYRLESLMLASQLREEIACHSSNIRIPSSLILEAITTLRCNEVFSMERLELLGDSVLKYSVSCHLFLKYPKKHEGQLSARRSWAVCNSTLHKLGTDRNLQGYIRDGAFEPRRWIAPGQRSIHPCPCSCGVDTLEVPLDIKFQTEDAKVVGKCCDRGHRWMGSKTISDCVEALIGAYYVGGGLTAALQLMKWLGVDAELEPSLVDEAIKVASLHSYIPKAKEIETLESKLGYEFSIRGLLLEAITHASEQELGVGYCYQINRRCLDDGQIAYIGSVICRRFQRLEFLGDSVLDILITWHLYQSHTDIDPGELTDLRSASVNNENFANVAVKKNLYQHLQHRSGLLLNQITEYVKFISGSQRTTQPLQGGKGLKTLGDLVESIAGAILIDTKLNLDEVWRIFEPLLSPIVTPDKLELPPLRELIELCDSLGYFIKENCIKKGGMVHAELRLQLKDVLLVGEGLGHNRKVAKGQAALHLLKDLESRGISYSKRRKQCPDGVGVQSTLHLDNNICSQTNADPSQPKAQKKQKTTVTQLDSVPNKNPYHSDDCSSKSCDIPVLSSINMKKGGPRTALYDLCKRLQWPMPTFKSTENKSRTPIEFCEGSERRTGFNSYASTITLTIPDSGVIELSGDQRADKKSSFDSAALLMLYELQRQGKLIIGGEGGGAGCDVSL